MTELPLEFKNNILDLHGSDGQVWLDKLPSFVHSIEKRWRIQVSAPNLIKVRGGIFLRFKIGVSVLNI